MQELALPPTSLGTLGKSGICFLLCHSSARRFQHLSKRSTAVSSPHLLKLDRFMGVHPGTCRLPQLEVGLQLRMAGLFPSARQLAPGQAHLYSRSVFRDDQPYGR